MLDAVIDYLPSADLPPGQRNGLENRRNGGTAAERRRATARRAGFQNRFRSFRGVADLFRVYSGTPNAAATF